jgi:Sigma-70, region 4
MEWIEAIRTLPLEQRVMIGAVWFKGLSVADIADQFDVSEQYVKAQLHYGLRSLKSAVDGDSERARSPVRHERQRQRTVDGDSERARSPVRHERRRQRTQPYAWLEEIAQSAAP